jgi:FGGY-family pentulose kinase
MTSYICGIDGGTECLKAAIYDLYGNLIALSSKPYTTYYEKPGWAEQKIDEWRDSLIYSVKDVISKSGINPKDIIGIGADGTCCTVVFLDKDNNPTRDPIIWMDVRSSMEAKLIESIDMSPRKYNGWGPVSAEWFPCKNLWVKKNQPDIFKKTAIIAEYTDWLTHEITGKWTISIATATVRGYYDNRNDGWPKDFYEAIGLKEIFDKIPEKVLRLGTLVGGVSKEFSDKTGLLEGTPVGEGCYDAGSACIGSNSHNAGQVFFVAGSGSYLQINLDKEFHSKGIWGSYPDIIVDNYAIEGGQTSTGSILKWFKSNFINSAIEEKAKNENMTVYKYLDYEAEKLPPGSEGIIMVEHFQGNRTPFVDPESRGVIRGLSLKHNTINIYRSIMEACAYGLETIFRVIKSNNFYIKEIIACGGHMNSDLWARIYSNVTGLPIKRTVNPEAATTGSAILGGVAAGAFSDINDGANRTVKFKEDVLPDKNDFDKYAAYVDKYISTYNALKDTNPELNELAKL